jgi:DNA-binding beta-propeller fold protein YncE
MTEKYSKSCHGLIGLCGLGLVLLSCAGCGKPMGEIFPPLETPVVWPAPPERAHVKFVGMISTEENLRREVSWTRGLGELIFGQNEIGVLRGPSAVALGPLGRLYIADAPGHVIHMFNLTNRKYQQFSSLGTDKTLKMPVALTVIDENLYVVDSVLHEVCIFDSKGKFLSSFGSEQLTRPSGIAYCSKRDNLYVSDTAKHVIHVFDKSGKSIETMGSRGVEPGQFNFPTHLWVDKNCKLYVSDTLNYRIQVFSPEDNSWKTFGGHGDRPGYFAHPAGIATDSFGHIYVTDRQFENIQIFDREGKILLAIGHEGAGLGEFWLPAGIFIDDQNRIYAADSFNKRVQVFTLLEVPEDED